MVIDKDINIEDTFSCYKKHLIGIIEVYNKYNEYSIDTCWYISECSNYFLIKEHNKLLMLSEKKITRTNNRQTEIDYTIKLKYTDINIEEFTKEISNKKDKVFLFIPKESIELKNIKKQTENLYEMLPLHIDVSDDFICNHNTCILNPNIMMMCDMDTLLNNIKNKDNLEK